MLKKCEVQKNTMRKMAGDVQLAIGERAVAIKTAIHMAIRSGGQIRIMAIVITTTHGAKAELELPRSQKSVV